MKEKETIQYLSFLFSRAAWCLRCHLGCR